jgi:hypothetical protein
MTHVRPLPSLIASGDNDLLSLGSFQGIPIIAPTQAISLIEDNRQDLTPASVLFILHDL